MRRIITLSSIVIVMACMGLTYGPRAYGAQITSRSLTLSSNIPSRSGASYSMQFSIATAGSMDSVAIEFCSNSALVEDPCIAPVGFNASGAVISAQSGLAGFIISPASNANTLILSHAPGNIQSAGPVSITFGNITNPSSAASYYSKILTYPTTDGSGSYTDFGALAFSINPGFDVSAEVPPYLTFCEGVTIDSLDCSTASGDQIALGQLSPATASVGISQFLVATNAASGYSVRVNGITMTSGNNTIVSMTGIGSHVGTSQFGINLRANTIPVVGQNPAGPGTATPTAAYNTSNSFKFHSNDIITSAPSVQDFRKYTVSYLVNVAKSQAPGVYSTTLTYLCLANF